jgi:hypothetical protein
MQETILKIGRQYPSHPVETAFIIQAFLNTSYRSTSMLTQYRIYMIMEHSKSKKKIINSTLTFGKSLRNFDIKLALSFGYLLKILLILIRLLLSRLQ